MQDETEAQSIYLLPAAEQYTRTRTIKVAEFTQLLQEVPLRSSVSCFIELVPVSHSFESGEEPLSSLLHKDHWVYYNNGLYLNIQTSLDGSESTHPILNEFVDGLLRAELWSKLGLELSISKSLASELSIALRQSVLGAEVKKTTKRKIPNYISAVNPPTGIPVTHIRSITVHITFSGRTPELPWEQTSIAPKACLPYSQILAESVSNAIEESCTRPIQPTLSTFSPQHAIKLQSRDPSFEDLSELPSPKLSPISNPSPYLTSPIIACPRREPGFSPSTSHSRKRTSQPPDYRRLLDSALQFCFFGAPSNGRNATIQTIPVCHGSPLADVSPALFSPGYLEAIRQRSTFIPSIVRSLKSIMDRSDIHQRFESARPPIKLGQELWLLAQRSLRTTDTTKRAYSFSAEGNKTPLKQGKETWDTRNNVPEYEDILGEEDEHDSFGISSKEARADMSDFDMLEFDPLEEYDERLDFEEMLDDQEATSDFKIRLNKKYGFEMEEVEILSD